ncbi:copper chaperone PCu(A)C [Streptomyces sp. Je 1-369]|uniref:copper chaperone PCu(A)C n=1 Tax=Streptomyces sp. Je 1-369 TaxID=2966192 RepID=UPI002285CB8A|nr:copper chaperone PCu(A)C [Streptomyces sp. Je 1-369]WAL98937.1 copper chaperone PCu(A)C [Streptomyces sp. Je 1-369]
MSDTYSWRPSRRRIREGLGGALEPVAACAVALGLLTVWTGSGGAGSPARVEVADGTVFLPYGNTRESAAFFRITNSGGSGDRLTSVASPVLDDVMLARYAPTGSGAAGMRMVDSAAVPAGEGLTMSPYGLDVMVRLREPLRLGERIPFVLTFREGRTVRTEAVVIRPSYGSEERPH